MTRKIGNGSIPLRIGRLIDTTVYGGPYRDVPDLFWGVKMAVEIDFPHMVAVDTKDFDVPKVSDLKAGIVKALMAMINEENVYAGCMGGIGRTGIFLAALAKVQVEYRRSKHRAGRGEDPVLYVRKHFIPHAVETAQQEKFIADLDVSDIVEWLNVTQTAMGLGGLTPARDVPVGAPIRGMEGYVTGEEPGTFKQAWIADADKIDNPAFDNFKQDWKQRGGQIEALVERDLDWVDQVEADSATEDAPEGNRMDDMQQQIDEVQDYVEKLTVATRNAIRSLEDRDKKSLTNATWSGKIRRLFS